MSSESSSKANLEETSKVKIINRINNFGLVRLITWILAISLSLIVLYLLVLRFLPREKNPESSNLPIFSVDENVEADLPQYIDNLSVQSENIFRKALLFTTVPDRISGELRKYIVKTGDSLFGIAYGNDITPESLLWANYSVLNDNPDEIVPGMELSIPPVDGVYYQWQEGDSFESVADTFETDVDKIINWFGNDIDLVNPAVAVGSWIMVVDGMREFKTWVIPIIARGAAGVSSIAFGPGGCTGPFNGAYGTGSFVWPSTIHSLSGNDFWSGHLALDITTYAGGTIMAADSGVVVFAGWANGGYGNTVMIDHGNGYATLYAHMNGVSTYCGASVIKGQSVGSGGSTGNSTGAHLHFEIRYLGGFINPWYSLPAP